MTHNTTESRLISLYKDAWANDTDTEITVQEFLDGIAIGRWQRHVDWVRLALSDKKEYDKRKKSGNAVTIGGTFNKRNANSIRDYSGLMAIDLDHLGSDLMRVFNLLKADGYVYAVFRSIGGSGLCVLFKINPDRWLDSFEGINQYLIETHGVVMGFDVSVKDVSRLRFVSYDPDIWVNHKAKLFAKYPRKEVKKPKAPAFVHSQPDIDHILRQIHSRGVDVAPTYHDWYRMGWSLISHYGEGARAIFQEVSQYNASYDAEECDRKFNYLVATRPMSITIGTFYYLCKTAGLDIMTPRTREIVSVAAMSKKQRISRESALDTVLKMVDGAERQAAEPIIEQVYASREEFDTQETLFDQLELFLKTNYSLRYNEITHYVEDNGEKLLDRNLLDIYVAAAKAFDMKVTKDNVYSLLLSGFVPGFHPVKDFFQRHKHIKKTGLIEALAATIKTDMGGINYVGFFLRKFLVGMVGTVYGDQCPLVPILTGGINLGKTQFWRRLLPDEMKAYYAETKFAKEGDDEMLMCKKLLLMNDDFDNAFLQRHARFKSLTDKHTFSIRKPYSKAHEDIARLAVIAGTSNEDNLLSDPTGNRRIIPINVIGIDHGAYNAIDKTELIMEAWHAYMSGERCDLTADNIAFLERHTSRFIDVSVEHDVVDKYFEMPTIKTDSMLLSQGEILVYLTQMTGLKNLKKNLISQEMKRMGFPYSDSEYYAPEKKTKRGFWLYKRSLSDSRV